MKIKDLYFRYFILILFSLCTTAFFFFFCTNGYNALEALRQMGQNFGSGIIGAILSLIVIRTQLEKFFDDINLKGSGIKGYRNGYPEILECLGGANKFFTLRINKKIDIFGIAMAEFFDTNSMVDLLCDRAKKGYKVRVFFADPNSEELENQEVIEKKEGELQLSIKRLTKELNDKLSDNSLAQKNIDIFHVKSLPRAFILRSGNKMIVTNYLYEGPAQAPSILLKDDEYLNAFEKYMDYIDASQKVPNSNRVNA